jgi:haloacetate dehalogenase
LSVGWFEGFTAARYDVDGTTLFARVGGDPQGPALVLLHGFPQSHVLWHRVAQRLAPHFRLVLPDLRGYGDSDAPDGGADHSGYSKRAMAADVVALMRLLGHNRFALAGHDRGGRVGHRLALDHPRVLTRLAVLDIAPTLDMYEATDMRFATAYHHWFHLIQPAPLPETMIGGDPVFYLHRTLGGWGAGGLAHVEPQALAEYERCFVRPGTVHAMCEDYRAAASVDLEHDRASRAAGELVLATFSCSVEPGEWSTRCSTRPRSGGHVAQARSRRGPCPVGTTCPRSNPKQPPVPCWTSSARDEGCRDEGCSSLSRWLVARIAFWTWVQWMCPWGDQRPTSLHVPGSATPPSTASRKRASRQPSVRSPLARESRRD